MPHESYQLERTGATWCVVKNGERVSDDYHEITVKGHGKFEGRIGARTKEFEVDTE